MTSPTYPSIPHDSENVHTGGPELVARAEAATTAAALVVEVWREPTGEHTGYVGDGTDELGDLSPSDMREVARMLAQLADLAEGVQS